mgnify:CR=1 FL=1
MVPMRRPTDAQHQGPGAARGAASGRFLDPLPVVEGSLDPLAPAAIQALFARLGIRPMEVNVDADDHDHPGTVHMDIAPQCGCAAA